MQFLVFVYVIYSQSGSSSASTSFSVSSDTRPPVTVPPVIVVCIFPTVSITECPHKVKLSIRNNETGEIVEGEIVTPQTEGEEEPDCE